MKFFPKILMGYEISSFFFLGYGILSSSDRISSAPMCAILNDRSLSTLALTLATFWGSVTSCPSKVSPIGLRLIRACSYLAKSMGTSGLGI